MTTDVEPHPSETEQPLDETAWDGVVDRVFEEPTNPTPAILDTCTASSDATTDPAELAVLGCMLLETEAARLAFAALRPEHFRSQDARAVFVAMQRVAPEDGAPDVVMVAEDLVTAGGRRFLSFLERCAAWPTAANARHYVSEVIERWIEKRQEVLVREAAAATSVPGRQHFIQELQKLDALRLAPDAAPAMLKSIRGDELMTTYYPPLEWLVGNEGEGLLYRGGITLLTASHKRGKSLSALGLAVAGLVRRHVFPGDDSAEFLGTKVTGSGAVVYLSAEGGPRLVKMRVAKIEPMLGEDLRHLVVIAERPLPRIDTDAGLAALETVIRDAGAVLLIVDPLSWFIRLENERDAGPVREIVERLRSWAERLNIGVLLVHHLKHVDADATPTASGGRGSSEWANAVDTVVSLWPDDEGDRKTSRVVFASRYGEPEPCKVRVNDETLLVEFVCRLSEARVTTEDGDQANRKVTDLEALRALKAIGTWATPRQWGEVAGLSKSAMHDRLPGLVRTGKVETRPGSRGGMEYRYVPDDRPVRPDGDTGQSEVSP